MKGCGEKVWCNVTWPPPPTLNTQLLEMITLSTLTLLVYLSCGSYPCTSNIYLEGLIPGLSLLVEPL